MKPGRFVTPRDDRAVLARPAPGRATAQALANRRALGELRIRLDGHPLQQVRAEARREVLALAREYLAEKGQPLRRGLPADAANRPWVVTGHQPELFHPGVWVKNFALARQADELGGVGLHLVADHDTLKSPTLRLPTGFDGDGPLRFRRVAFDQSSGEAPYEARRIADPRGVRRLPRARRRTDTRLGLRADARPPVAAIIGTARRGTRRRALRLAAARGRAKLGRAEPRTPREPASRHRGVPAVRLPHPPRPTRFVAGYNTAIRDYRRRNRLRSKNHPAPELEVRGTSLEAPFWRLGATGQRERPFHNPHAIPDLAGLRPRALTLTLFARLVLADDFLHGVGGGKYDEVTDAILSDYFGVEPPAYQVWTATLFLPIQRAASRLNPAGPAPSEWAERWRAAEWNPATALPEAVRAGPAVAALLAERAELLAEASRSKAARHRRFFAVRAVTAAIREATRPLLADWERGAEVARQSQADRAVAAWREASWGAVPRGRLARVPDRGGWPAAPVDARPAASFSPALSRRRTSGRTSARGPPWRRGRVENCPCFASCPWPSRPSSSAPAPPPTTPHFWRRTTRS